MLKHRLILGPIMIAALLGVLWLDQWAQGHWDTYPGMVLLVLLVLPCIQLASREIATLLKAKDVPTDARVLSAAGMFGCVGIYLTTQDRWALDVPPTMVLASLGILVLLIALLARCWRRNTEGTMLAAAAAGFAFIYLGLMPGSLLAIRAEHTVWVLASVLLVTKSCDIGAYFTGRAIGKHKLIPWLSPGKTWEGLGGGVVLAALVSLGTLMPLADLHWAYALLCGVVLGLVGQAGDLLASMLKRDAAVKDSGASVPGFGGVLDVIDSPLLAAPVGYWLLALAG